MVFNCSCSETNYNCWLANNNDNDQQWQSVLIETPYSTTSYFPMSGFYINIWATFAEPTIFTL